MKEKFSVFEGRNGRWMEWNGRLTGIDQAWDLNIFELNKGGCYERNTRVAKKVENVVAFNLIGVSKSQLPPPVVVKNVYRNINCHEHFMLGTTVEVSEGWVHHCSIYFQPSA